MLHRELSKAEVYTSIITMSIQALILIWVLALDYHLEQEMLSKGINIEEMLKK